MEATTPGGEGEEEDIGGTEAAETHKRKIKTTPLDQGEGETCTIHALSNAVCQSLLEDYAVDVDLRECLGGLKQLTKVEVYGGNDVEDFDSDNLRNMMDAATGRYGTIKVLVKRARKLKDYMKSKKCVLVYERTLGDPSSTHCVYVRETVVSEKGELSCYCINSWGRHDPTPIVVLNKTKHIVYRINVQWIPVTPGSKELSILKDVKAISDISFANPSIQDYSISDQIMTLSDSKYVKGVILIGIGVFGKVVNLILCYVLGPPPTRHLRLMEMMTEK